MGVESDTISPVDAEPEMPLVETSARLGTGASIESPMTLPHAADRTPSPYRIILAFAAVYLIWGSTYLAIRYAIDSFPPLLMAGTRFLVAGSLLYAYARWRGAPRPTAVHWRTTSIVGGLLLLGGNGGVVTAEKTVPSGLAALIVATVPLWMVVVDWVRPGGSRPTARVALGLLAGLAGVALLIFGSGGREAVSGRVDLFGGLILVAASLSWSIGSIYSRHAPLPKSPLMATAMEMLAGGALLALAGLALGQGSELQLSAVTGKSVLAVVYLIVFGSLIGFSAYVWLLQVTTPARAGTYAYVNPVVAVGLGYLVAGEPLTRTTLIAAAIILTAVVIITTQRGKPRQA